MKAEWREELRRYGFGKEYLPVMHVFIVLLSLILRVSGKITRYNTRNPSAGDPYDSLVVCEVIADDFIKLITQHEILDTIREKHQEERDWESQDGFFEEEGRQFLTMELMKEMRHVREKILNASFEPFTHATTPPRELDITLRGDVDHIYHQLRDLKLAEWNQETENEEAHWNVIPMKQLGYRLDVSFMALVFRCLLPKKTQDSNVCEVIASDYNDLVLNDEIVDFANQQKGVEQQGVITNTDDVSFSSKREYEARQSFATSLNEQMREERVNILNAYYNKTILKATIQEEVEYHYQVIKHLRTQQWRLETESTSRVASPWWSLRSVASRVSKDEMKQLDTILDRSFMLLLGRCLKVHLFG